MFYWINYYYPEHERRSPQPAEFECRPGYEQIGPAQCRRIPNEEVNPGYTPSACPAQMITSKSGKCITQEGDGKGRYWTRQDPAGITRQSLPGYGEEE